MNYAILVAGGSGQRMKSSTPKQFIELAGKPILYYTIRQFLTVLPDIQIVLVLPEIQASEQFIRQTLPEFNQVEIVYGGPTRFHSVKNGLNAIPNQQGIVFIHDGVRPFVSSDVLHRCLDTAQLQGSAIPCLPLKDSIRMEDENGNYAADRTRFKIIQTPQTFQIPLIQKAFNCEYNALFTDEASVFEASGSKPVLIEGNDENIKITTPQDLILAAYYIAEGANLLR
jgi:2-C-methyl-D-erythritol 4-phosphate cytidylyltransferase